ncbi:hypothetical protein GCM10007100_02310 [Roseibacillus persicicus]|uniref:Uncharacterized protein n=2 Tax=Roseibacillus persicicus TaxID=454148 RepID=A0A918TDV1_9BACT|nr:hypothetical protein GCM10007100_02310 [Roseibacillus persicicus]
MGVHALYVSPEGETAKREYRFHIPTGEAHQFIAYLRCRLLLDLQDESSWATFGLEERDFFAGIDRRMKRESLPLHQIGAAIAERKVFGLVDNIPQLVAGIAFPSNACHQSGITGTNFALFRNAFEDPNSLEPMKQAEHLQPTLADRWPISS